jgi:uncharacterized protein (PEP-CTERM system associated)
MMRVAAATAGTGRYRIQHVSHIGTLLVLGFISATTASAQISTSIPSRTPSQGESWRVTRSISVQATATDNVALAPDDQKESDLILTVSPAVNVVSTGGRVKLNLNYRLHGLLYAGESSNNDVRNDLDATANAELLNNWLFLDANAAITQQAISPFGAQPILNNENVNNNRSETFTYRVSPYVRGILASVADYELRYSRAASRASGIQFADSYVDDWMGQLRGLRTFGRLGWTLDANNTTIHPDVGRDTTSRRVRASLIYEWDPQFRTTGLIGYETNNFSNAIGQDESAVTYGGVVEWSPTPRTRFRGLYEKRPFGDTYDVAFEHRTRLSVWTYTDNRTLTSLPAQLAVGRTSTAFNLLFDALVTRFPDPVARAQEVQRILLQTGIPADLAVAPLFLTSRATIQHARQASVGLLGVRNTLTITGALVDTEAADTSSQVVDDLSRFSEVRQRSLTGSWSLRVTPFSTLNLTASHIRTTSQSAQDVESKQTTGQLLLTHQFGPRTTGTVGVRYVHFDSTTAPDFREKAATASLLVTY